MGIAERKEREKKERRRLIMEAAKSLFGTKGYTGTTMEDIAGEVELSPATIYLYFRNKEELYAAFSLEFLGELMERLGRRYNGGERSSEDEIRALKEEMLRSYENDPLVFRSVFHFQTSDHYKNMSPELVEEVKSFAGRALRFTAGIFERGIQKGIFKDRNPIALADMLWGTFAGLTIWEESKAAFDPNKKYLKETLDTAVEILIEGIKKAEDRPIGHS